MRQYMSAKNTRKLAEKTGLDVVAVLCRGGSHRKDLCLADGTIASLYPDGTIEQTNYKHTRGIEQ